jgi:hypothetical protein
VFHSHRADDEGLRQQIHDYGLGSTALLTALVWHDPRHLLGMAAQLPRYFRARRAGAGTPAATSVPDPLVPGDLARSERRGRLAGPPAYLRSRMGARRRTAAVPPG